MENKIAVIGLGYVGNRLFNFFESQGFQTYSYDINGSGNLKSIEELNKKNVDFALICVPTPMTEGGECDTSIVEDCIKKINANTIVIRSTVVPGTTDRLEKETGKDLIFMPEYFGETKNHLLNSMDNRDFFIIGGRKEVRKKLIDLLKNIFDSKNIKFHLVDSITAEIIKYMENSYLATKVLFCEEFYRICESFGVDYYQVREGWLLDPRINPSHTFPRKDGLSGFGGKCLSKDLSAIITASTKVGYNPELLKQVFNYNKKLRSQQP